MVCTFEVLLPVAVVRFFAVRFFVVSVAAEADVLTHFLPPRTAAAAAADDDDDVLVTSTDRAQTDFARRFTGTARLAAAASPCTY